MYTGVNAGKSGVFAMSPVNRKSSLLEIESGLINSTKVRSRSLWKILSEYGKRVGVVNIPVTYPVEQVNGFLISGFLTPSKATDYFYPPNSKDELIDYKIDIDFGGIMGELPRGGVDKTTIIEEQYRVTRRRVEVCSKLIEKYKPDFFIVNFKGVDNVQHLFWDNQEVIFEFLNEVDSYIDELQETMNPDVTIIMSDHGFHARSIEYFHINSWLKENGYLTAQKGRGALQIRLYNMGIALSQRFSSISKIVPDTIQKWIMSEKQASSQINLEKTKAFGTRWGVYINADPKNRPPLKQELVNELIMATDDRTGGKFFQRVIPKEEIFSGPYFDNLPNIILLPNPRYRINPNIHKNLTAPRVDSPLKTADHTGDPFGIIIVAGNMIARGKRIEDAKLIDLAPTILHMMDVSIPPEMDGRILRNIFSEETELFRKPAQYSNVSFIKDENLYNVEEKQDKEIQDRLKALGYIE